MRAILDDILGEDNLRVLVGIVRSEAGPTNQKQQQQLASIDQQIKELNRQENRLIDAYSTSNISVDKLNARIVEIQAKMAEQEAKKSEVESLIRDEATILNDPERIVAYAKDVRTYLQQDNVKSVNAICKRFVKAIWFEPGYARIEYAIRSRMEARNQRSRPTRWHCNFEFALQCRVAGRARLYGELSNTGSNW